MTTKNDAAVDNCDEKKTDGEKKENSSKSLAQETKPHPAHSFQWSLPSKEPTLSTCNKAGTVEDVLKRSANFRTIAEGKKDKELVLIRKGNAISSHFPCSLIGNEHLTVKYVKPVAQPKKTASGSHRKGPSSELVMFHVLTNGGKNIVKILQNPALRSVTQGISVYAYKGEKLKQALKRDGRFHTKIFKKNCALCDQSSHVNTDMDNLVDDLDGKTFQIILRNNSSAPESQPESLDDASTMPSGSQNSDSGGNQEPSQQSTTTESDNDKKPKMESKLSGNEEPEKSVREIPDSKMMRDRLYSQFSAAVKRVKTQPKLSRIQNLFRKEFGQNDQLCREVKMMKKLMQLSNSVCQVRINGSAAGSGFLFFGSFVLTNAHVIKSVYESRRQLDAKVTVHFSFECLKTVREEIEVEEVVGYEYARDVSSRDWALLKIRANQTLPAGLLTYFGSLPQNGGICIIGHPGGGVKKIDPCLIVTSENCLQVVERHYNENQENIQLITSKFFDGVAISVQQNVNVLTYESCFYEGSSGSPVFDKHCNVVAMHTGGYLYEDKTRSVIEYGQPLSAILEHILIQIAATKRTDVMDEYHKCTYAEQHNRTDSFIALGWSSVNDNEILNMTSELVSVKKEPVPMEID
ncbi:serine protease FAM111A-like [Embiotoca jacksoni]|uniref:serine protease FAM111A-like n=1 Tax=Embiotoca jacksoni TaxID=100190 RepID=UPI003703B97C